MYMNLITFFVKTAFDSDIVASAFATLGNAIQIGSCLIVLCCPR